jgi:cobalt/nickel transport system permease protein
VSHLHIPDGVLPLWLVGLGWAVAAVYVGLALLAVRKGERTRLVPRVGVVAALVLAGMSTEIVPIAYHLNLTVLAGIILGPAAGVLAAFVVNIILALFGHGGVTVIGLNTVVIGTEVVAGFLLFRGLSRLLGTRLGLAAGLATVLALALSTTLMIGVVGLSRIAPAHARDLGSLDPGTLRFANPFGHGLVANRIITPEQDTPAGGGGVSLARFAVAVYALAAIGWAIEATLTGFIVGFVARVRGELLRPGEVGESWT